MLELQPAITCWVYDVLVETWLAIRKYLSVYIISVSPVNVEQISEHILGGICIPEEYPNHKIIFYGDFTILKYGVLTVLVLMLVV